MRLRDLIAEVVEIQIAMGNAAKAVQADPSRRSDLIDMRRHFARQVVIISEAIGQDRQLAADGQLAGEFRKRFSDMRTKVAVHQAKWPAVLLDNADPDFDKSADDIIQSNREFATWALAVLRK